MDQPEAQSEEDSTNTDAKDENPYASPTSASGNVATGTVVAGGTGASVGCATVIAFFTTCTIVGVATEPLTFMPNVSSAIRIAAMFSGPVAGILAAIALRRYLLHKSRANEHGSE